MMKEDRGVKQEKYEQEIVTDDNQVVSPPNALTAGPFQCND